MSNSLIVWIAGAAGLTPATVVVLVSIFAGLGIATLLASYLAREAPDRGETELEQRIRSWWVIVALVAGALLLGRTMALIFFAGMSYLALKEYFSIVPTRQSDRSVLLLIYLAVPLQFLLIAYELYGIFIVFVPVWMFMALQAAMVMRGQTEGFLKAAGTLYWGLMATVYSLGHVAYLLVLPKEEEGIAEGAALVLALLILTEFNDVAQYVAGKTLGRHKIIPRVSPAKTWEGFLGGLVATVVMAFALVPLLLPHLPSTLTIPWWLYATMIGAGLAVAGFFGDVTESAVKRDLGRKDSGTMIPGHGGILDRVDSLIFTAPLFFHVTRYFGSTYW